MYRKPEVGSIIKLTCFREPLISGRLEFIDGDNIYIDIGKVPISMWTKGEVFTRARFPTIVGELMIDTRSGTWISHTLRGYEMEMQQVKLYDGIKRVGVC